VTYPVYSSSNLLSLLAFTKDFLKDYEKEMKMYVATLLLQQHLRRREEPT
jgi:hypothetical protein